MGFKKFGTGEVLGTDAQGQIVITGMAQDPEWTEADEQGLQEETPEASA